MCLSNSIISSNFVANIKKTLNPPPTLNLNWGRFDETKHFKCCLYTSHFLNPKNEKIICWPKNDLNHIDSNGCTCLNFKIDNVFINISLDSLDTKKMKQRPGHIVKYLKKQALNRSPPLRCKMLPPPTIPVQYEERSIVCFCLDAPLDILWPQFTTHTILGQQHLTSSERWSNKNPKQSSVISTCCCIMNWLRHIGALTTNHWWILRPWNKTIHGSWTRSPTVLFNIHLSESVFRGEIYIYTHNYTNKQNW